MMIPLLWKCNPSSSLYVVASVSEFSSSPTFVSCRSNFTILPILQGLSSFPFNLNNTVPLAFQWHKTEFAFVLRAVDSQSLLQEAAYDFGALRAVGALKSKVTALKSSLDELGSWFAGSLEDRSHALTLRELSPTMGRMPVICDPR